MKKIGIVGGLGPEATIDYYKEIINAFKNESGDLSYPEIIVYSVNISEFLGLMHEQHIDSLILGCTEFPLILTENLYAGIPMLNTTKIHVDAIARYCRS